MDKENIPAGREENDASFKETEEVDKRISVTFSQSDEYRKWSITLKRLESEDPFIYRSNIMDRFPYWRGINFWIRPK